MTDTTNVAEKITRRDLAEGKIEKVLNSTDLVPVSADSGSVRFEDTIQMANTAKLMATAGPLLPAWLQGNVGGCFGIIMRATELRISPLALAEWSYVVEKGGVQRVSYMSAFFRAIVELRAPIKEHTLKYEILGEGDARRCKVWATFKDELEPREFISEPLSVLRPKKNDSGQTKGSPLWDRKPEVQMYYDAGRDWARINTPSLVAGMYTPEELKEHGWEDHVGADNAKDVTPSNLKLRLGAAKPERAADLREHVNAAFDEQQSAADGGKALPAAETAAADELESPAAAEGAATTSSPRHPVAAPTNSAPTDIGGAALGQSVTPDDSGNSRQANVVPDRISTGVSGQAAGATTITDSELQAAFDRGKADHLAGKKRSAVPTEWRDDAHRLLSLKWIEGFMDTPGGKR